MSFSPGGLLKIESISDGSYIPLVGDRTPATFSISLTGINGSPKFTVEDFSLSNLRSAVNDLLNQEITGNTPAYISFEIQEIFSSEQLKVAVGGGYKSPGVKVSGNFNWGNNAVKSRFLVKFTQVYYTIDMDIPEKPSDLFHVVPDHISFGSYSPGYVSSVKYGRMALFTVESSEESSEMSSALQASFNGFVASGNIDISHGQQSVLNSSSIKAFIVGGDATEAVNAVGGVDGLMQYLTQGGNFSSQSKAAPLSYTMRFLKDNSIARVVLSSEYTIRNCEPLPTDTWQKKPFDENPYFICPDHVLGDDDWGGKVEAKGDVELEIDGQNIVADVDITFTEFHGPGVYGSTQARIKQKVPIGTIPSDQTFVRFLTDPSSSINFIDTDDGLDFPPVMGGRLVKEFQMVGDTDGPDLPCDGSHERSFLKITFNEVKLQTRQR